ncbi:MAG: cytochrome bc complex cytochrome b subunit [Gemmatimonadetes bacterium]|nr:cytochrome bc complex cytochrome b subunit [Gemmatimonadota bacterium]
MIAMRKWIARWLSQFWNDLKASTDTGVLAVARFVGLLYGPIDGQLRIDEALRKALRYRLPGHVSWRHALGGITYLLFIVLIVTGVLLSFYYRPSAQEAYPSIRFIVSQVSLGWLMRDLHVWAASLIVIAVLAHMARVFVDAAYKPPRETNWLVGLLLLFLVLAFGASGYLLPWDQWSYWTVTQVLDTLSRLPLLGPIVVGVLRGDSIVSGATLSRFFAIHVIILPWVALALLGFHFTLVRKHGIAPPKHEVAGTAPSVPFFPHHLLRSLRVALVVLAIVISAAALFPRPVAHVANPYEPPDQLVSTWVPVDVSLALIRYLGPWGLALFTLLGVALALIPLFDRRPERDLRHRPLVAALGLVFLLGFAGAWLVGRQVRSVLPSARSGEPALEAGSVPAEPGVVLPDLGPTPPRPADPAPAALRGAQ